MTKAVCDNLFGQVGLVIGNISGKLDRGFIFDLIPTPVNDNGEPACSIIGEAKDDRKKAPKGKSLPNSSTLFIDKDWLAEHARQVPFEIYYVTTPISPTAKLCGIICMNYSGDPDTAKAVALLIALGNRPKARNMLVSF